MASKGGNFGVGFMRGFLNAKARREDKEEREKELKARTQLFELQLKREQRIQAQEDQQTASQDKFFESAKNRMAGVRTFPLPGTGVELGDVNAPADPQPPRSLSALLAADPEIAMQALRAGVVGADALLPKAQEDPNAALLGQMNNPALREFVLQLKTASANNTNINLGNEGLSKPPPGYARPNPRNPGLVREEGGPPTPGQESLDKAFGTDAAAWVAAGGFADTEKSIRQLSEVKLALDSGKGNLTGPAVSRIPEFAKPLFNPAAVAARDATEEIVQRNLRLILGAQFTEKEGERLIARSYNENLSEAENAKRLGRIIKQIEDAAKAKQEAVDYFNEHGTLEGFKGKVWTMADFDPGSESKAGGKEINFEDLPD